MRIGYARVSKREQSLRLQLDELKAAGCQKIYTDKLSALEADRPALIAAIASLRVGDQLVVWKLDRFARDLLDQLLLLRAIQLKGGSLVTLTEVIDTSDWMGNVMSRQMAIYAEVELQRIRERTRIGVKRAIERGVRFGRPVKLSEDQVQLALARITRGEKAQAVAQDVGVGRSTLFRLIAKLRHDERAS